MSRRQNQGAGSVTAALLGSLQSSEMTKLSLLRGAPFVCLFYFFTFFFSQRLFKMSSNLKCSVQIEFNKTKSGNAWRVEPF